MVETESLGLSNWLNAEDKENGLVKAPACLTTNKFKKWEEHKGNGLLKSNIQKGV